MYVRRSRRVPEEPRISSTGGKLTDSAHEAAQLSEQRFNAGTTHYLGVLTNNTNYFSDEPSLAQAQLNELQALVQLYEALGGGWQQ
jgi:outer membrane protein, multidrug efflux system